MSYRVVLVTAFLESIKHLKKKYPHANEDAKIALQVLIENPLLGVMIPGGDGARKLRVRNSDLKRGKSGGYRLVYFVDGSKETLFPLLLYSKTERADISRKELEELIKYLKKQVKL